MTLDITQFYQTFFDEADELLAQMEQLLLVLDIANPDPEDLAAIFRAAHSIKGGAATFGFTALTETTHILESLLDRARNNELVLRRDMIDTFLATKDVLSDQLAAYRASAEPDAAAAAAICAKLERLKHEDPEAPAAPVIEEAAAVIEKAQQHEFAYEGPNAPPAHVIAQAAEAIEDDGTWDGAFEVTDGAPIAGTAAAASAAEAGPHLKITLRGVGEKDLATLTEELGNLGSIVGEKKTDAELVLWLESDVSADDIVAVCCFVIDESQIGIGRGNAADQSAQSPAASVEVPPATAAHHALQQQPDASQALDASASTAQQKQQAATAAVPETAAQPSQKPANANTNDADKKARPAAAASAEGSSIRVGVEKVDQLINLVGELVITQAMLAETTSTFDPALHDRLFNGMAQLERNARDLQEAVMSIRMMPMDYVFSRFPRLVRDIAGKLGKDVELVTFGQATELDKSLIERIIDPLTHLVRNSLDHGIETVEARRAAGKSTTGQLVLSAAHHGGNIVIEVSDDGAGLRRDKILAKAQKQGMQVSESMSDEEVWQLIFMPGFSTAEQVTDISGRGVGMDVVKRNIQSMGGHVEIKSREGAGTTTKIVLPLTLAILDGMSVKVGSEIFILPLNFVMESLQPVAEDIYTVANGERVVRVRGEYLPLVALHAVFDVENARTEPTQGIVTIMQTEGRRFAMLIDELVGQQQVVVKNLETNYRKVHGISAATILGDGSVALIVDVAALNRESRVQHSAHAH
ncbi:MULTISPECIES: chemotaxis protein CheA [unclassified Caballeronia]|uniref:chemotaxis protein CheA n=1 Tax=unclassified Caballeronia TaxID=2646786 RepID=UPI002856CC53|nr:MULTISPECIES: chemotaxis protein CheA [unclassified Caballeronia]MDR5770315.1 chemotaxis protein CheA [Caballeronia sp. LZ002]MDR5845752.1 chemotaxis protein CheA [Caballeronia sp. LZ003]